MSALTRPRVERIVRACRAQRARERANGCEQNPTQTQRLAEELLEAWDVLYERAVRSGVVYAHPAPDYVTLQVDREVLSVAREIVRRSGRP